MSPSQILSQLQQPRVRDLAWTLASEPLVNEPTLPLQHPLNSSLWHRQPETLNQWLRQLDAAPAPLLEYLEAKASHRLGLYYERLWQFALHNCPDLEVLAANLAVRQEGHTLGEIDLLLNTPDGLKHIELAVKFYLQLPSTLGDLWIGPSGDDRLDKKLAHLIEHQLPLVNTEAGRAAIAPLSCAPCSSQMWLAGYLFNQWLPDTLVPVQPNIQTQGVWVEQALWPAFVKSRKPGIWQPLQRLSWLAPARIAPSALCTPDTLTQQLAQPSLAPTLLARLTPHADGYWHEAERAFCVPKNWPNHLAPKPSSPT